jgi:hypothetical protein
MEVPPRSRTGRLQRLRSMFTRSTDERGFVLAYSGLLLTTLVAMGGFAVDVGNWYLQGQRLQRSADSAALAGSVYLPGEVTAAKTIAQNNLVANVDHDQIKSIKQRDGHPTQLQVELTKTVPNHFVSLLGYKEITLKRKAIGEYRPYIPMGSPSNLLGDEPSNSTSWEKATTVSQQNNYWLNISAAGTEKSTGDRYNSGPCSGADGCNTSLAAPYRNVDYSPTGQTYVVRINAGTTGTLALEAYDAGLAHVGDNCGDNLTNANTYSPPGTNLYRSGNNEPACTGDNVSGGTPPNTTYQLFTPELSAGGSQPVTMTGCQAKTYNGYNGQIVNKVNPGAGTFDATFTSWFRKWNRFCTLVIGPGMPAGDYILRVSNGNSTTHTGLNRFALRAAMLTTSGTVDTVKTTNLSLFAKGRLVVYAHENTGDVVFYIARLQSGAAGRNLTVTLFDIGDATGGASLAFLPPSDASIDTTDDNIANGTPLTTFDNCRYTPPGQVAYMNTPSGCRITGMTSGSYGGRIVNITVPIPLGYTCNDASSEGCWTRLRIQYGAGTTQDTTSWEVALDGNPVRLID